MDFCFGLAICSSSLGLIALRSTATHRETTHIFNSISNRLEEISDSEALRSRWLKYTKNYRYADGITYEDVLDAIRELIKSL